MGRFFDKSELIIIVSLILIFDINASTTEFLNYIYYNNISGLLPYILIMGALLIDINMLKQTININEPFTDKNNDNDKDNDKLYLKKAKNLILFFVLISILITFMVSVFRIPDGMVSDVNSIGTRFIRASPLLLLMIYLIHNID